MGRCESSIDQVDRRSGRTGVTLSCTGVFLFAQVHSNKAFQTDAIAVSHFLQSTQ